MTESEQKLLDAELLKGETIRWSEAHTIVYHPGCVGNAIALAIGGCFAFLGIATLYYGYSLETPGAVTEPGFPSRTSSRKSFTVGTRRLSTRSPISAC